MTRLWLVVAVLGVSARPASAELAFFTSGQALSIRGHRVEGESTVLALRGGGEMICDVSLVARYAPDEVPYPEPAGPALGGSAPGAELTSPLRGPVAVRTPLPVNPKYDPVIRRVAAAHGVDAELVRAVIQVESAYQPNARSRKGAVGLMQVMPATGRAYGARNLWDPVANIEVGIRHLKSLLERFPLKIALAAYNAGQATVERFHGVPPYRETEEYVARVLALVGA